MAIAAGDFNRDNIIDLAAVNQTDGTVTILQGIGNGSFTVVSSAPVTGSTPAAIALGDFNADGKLDLAVANSGAGTLSVMLGNGDSTFQARTDTTVGTAPAGVATGDFNKDGTLDLVVANQTSNNVSLLLGTGGTGGGAVATITPSSLSFGTIAIGVLSAKQTVTLKNTGTANLVLTSITVTPSDYMKTNHCGRTVAPGASCAVDVAFKPTIKGLRTGTLSFNDNAPGSPQTVSLTGTGTAAGFNPTSVNFGSWTVGTTSGVQNITLTNVAASGTMTITNVTIIGTNASDFTVQSNNCSSLTPGQSCTIGVTFTPSAVGVRSANLSVTDNGGGSPQSVPLSGSGT